jgi:hypothetical protein
LQARESRKRAVHGSAEILGCYEPPANGMTAAEGAGPNAVSSTPLHERLRNMSLLRLASTFISIALLSTGCAVNANDDAEPSERVATTQEAIATGWTAYTSEEYAPIVCDPGSVIDMAACTGRYCDNMAIHCVKAPAGTPGAVRYTGYTWDNDYPQLGSYVGCAEDEFVTGLTCKDSYCGHIAVQCTKYSGVKQADCRWAGFFSEEAPNNVNNFGAGYYGRGFACYGDHCDNVLPMVCQMVATKPIIDVSNLPIDVIKL